MSKFSKIWELAMRLYHFKKNNPDKEIIEIDDELYYKGLLLQEKENGDVYYEEVLYKIK